MLLPLLALALTAPAPAVEFTSISWVRGVRYETKVTQADIDKSGGRWVIVPEKDKPNHHLIMEPKGIPFPEILAKAEAEAVAILGKDYTDKDGRWVMNSAERVECGEDGAEGYYYQVSYQLRRSAPIIGDRESNLTLYVMIDGTLLKPEKIEDAK